MSEQSAEKVTRVQWRAEAEKVLSHGCQVGSDCRWCTEARRIVALVDQIEEAKAGALREAAEDWANRRSLPGPHGTVTSFLNHRADLIEYESALRQQHSTTSNRHVCPECGEHVARDGYPLWVDPSSGQRHHDPCPSSSTSESPTP